MVDVQINELKIKTYASQEEGGVDITVIDGEGDVDTTGNEVPDVKETYNVG